MNRPKTDRELRDEAIAAQIYRELGKEAMDLRKEAEMELRKEVMDLRTVEKELRKVEKKLRRIDKEVSKIEEVQEPEQEIAWNPMDGFFVRERMKKEDATEIRGRICDDVKNIVCKDRADLYGKPEDSFETIATGWTWFLRAKGIFGPDQYLTPMDVADLMTILKMGRAVSDPYNMDTRKDAAGYQVIAGSMIAPREPVPGVYGEKRLPKDE